MCPGKRRGPGNSIRGVILLYVYVCCRYGGERADPRTRRNRDGGSMGSLQDCMVKRGEGLAGRKEGEMFIKYSSCSVNTAHTP